MKFARTPSHCRPGQRGVGLLEPLIAICILGFGILGLARFQLNMLAQNSDSKLRLNATTLAEELLSQVHMAPQANAGCYTKVPPTGSCNGMGDAAGVYSAWEANTIAVMGGLAGVDKSNVSANSTLSADGNQLTVVVTWASKPWADQSGQIVTPEKHTHTVTTDVRP